MNILFRGGGFSNKGDEAMMLTIQREFTARLPGVNWLLRVSRRALEEAHSHGLLAYVPSGGGLRRASRLASQYAVNKAVRRAIRLDVTAAETVMDAAPIDGVLDFSGFNYSDEWGVRCAQRGLVWADYCHKQGKPHLCLPQAWGPFRKADVAGMTRRLCEYSSVVYARDRVSLSHLRELLGHEDGAVRLAPDIAFLFRGENPIAGRRALEALGVDPTNSPIVGLTPNMRVYERCSGVGAGNEYIRMMVKIAEHCIRTWGTFVVLLPHELSVQDTPRRDDRFLCALIRAGVSYPDRCSMLGTYISASLLKSIEGQLDLMIGSRFHSCVFALSAGVPAVALGWAHKYAELMELVGLGRDTLMHTQFDEKNVMEVLDTAWKQRGESAATIQGRLPEIRNSVTLLFDEVADVLRQYHASTN